MRCPRSMMLMSSCLIVIIRSNTYRPRVVSRACAALTKTCCVATCRSGSSRTMLLWCVRERDAVQRDADAVLMFLCLFPSLDRHVISRSSVACYCSHAFLPQIDGYDWFGPILANNQNHFVSVFASFGFNTFPGLFNGFFQPAADVQKVLDE